MRRLWLLCLVAAVLAAWSVGLAAQDPVRTLQRVNTKLAPATGAPAPAPAAAASGPMMTPPPPSSPAAPSGPTPEDNLLMEGETLYRHQSERDPFTPLIRTGAGQGQEVKVRPGTTGITRFTVEACVLEAVLRVPSGTVAWFQGPDNKPYKVGVGERFADGVVLDISYDSGEVTVQQELNDPTAIKPFRNLVLRIRNVEGEGQ